MGWTWIRSGAEEEVESIRVLKEFAGIRLALVLLLRVKYS